MVIDIIFVVMALYGFYLGFSKGIIQTVFTFISIVLGGMTAMKFGPDMTNFLESITNNNNPLMFIAGFIITFIMTMMFIRLLARGLEGILKTGGVNVINQIAGGALLSAMMILLYSVLLWFGDSARMVDNQTKKESLTYEYLQHYPAMVKDLAYQLQPTVEEFWNESLDALDRLKDISEKTEVEEVFDIEDEEE